MIPVPRQRFFVPGGAPEQSPASNRLPRPRTRAKAVLPQAGIPRCRSPHPAPSLSQFPCAVESGARTLSSSDPPDERRPTTFKVTHFAWSPELTFKSSPIFAPILLERFTPTTHCSESSPNHCPWTPHQGFVFTTPVRNVAPSGISTRCCAQVPIKDVWHATAGVIQVWEAREQASM